MTDPNAREMAHDKARLIASLAYLEAKREGFDDEEAEALAMEALGDCLE
jgi:hypothetical protein